MITTEKIFEIWEIENLTIKDIIKEKFLQFENILKDFEKIWYDLIDVFFDEKEFWDYFFIDSKDLILFLINKTPIIHKMAPITAGFIIEVPSLPLENILWTTFQIAQIKITLTSSIQFLFQVA